MARHKIGLLIGGTEEDWPTALEMLFRRFDPIVTLAGAEPLHVDIERVRVHPFDLRAGTTYDLVIDRLSHWQLNPREWLKKAALLDQVYLLNNPFTFQSMEKHSAYVAMIRLGFYIPKTWLIPPKSYPDERWLPAHRQQVLRHVRPAGAHRRAVWLSAVHETV